MLSSSCWTGRGVFLRRHTSVTDNNRSMADFLSDIISWIQALKSNNFEKILRTVLRSTLSANFEELSKSTLQTSYSWKNNQHRWWGCDPQNLPQLLQQKPSFMASLPAGEQAVTATVTAVPAALVVQVDSPPLPPLLCLQPPTMLWHLPTPTYISSVCRQELERKPASCCLYQSSWGAAALAPLHPLSWCCTGTPLANGEKVCHDAGRWGPT